MKTRLFVSLILALMILVPAGAGAVGVGRQCGGFAGIQCNAGLFCQHPTGACFIFDITGTCARIPRFCPRIYRPVCGCNGQTYANDCVRQAAMVSKSHDGKCLF